MSRMLLCFDGSEHATRATQFVTEFVIALKAPEICVLNVQNDPADLGSELQLSFDSLEQAQALAHEQGRTVLKAAEELLDRAMSPSAYSVHIRLGARAESIIQCAVDLSCDLVVIGSRGLGAIQSVLLGSVTIKVLHLSSIPVIVVR